MADKIRIMTDSASDVSPEQAENYGIDLLGFPITIGDKGYREHVDFTNKEFYQILEESDELPHTSQVTVFDYTDAYNRALEDGVTELINVVIAKIGSNSYNNAVMAKETFFEEHPELVGRMNITVMDSKGYTGVYGFPVVEAAKKIQKGAKFDEIIAFLEDWFDSGIIVCTAFTLKYAKKSGRVGCATAFVGEVLGIKPIITFVDAVSETVAKVRGEKNVVPQMVDVAIERMVPQTPYAILAGSREDCTKEVTDLMKKRTGYPPTEIFEVGATIACHLGHAVSGVIIKGQNRKN